LLVNRNYLCLGVVAGPDEEIKLLSSPFSPRDANLSRALATSHIHRHVSSSNTTEGRTTIWGGNRGIFILFRLLFSLCALITTKGVY